jgi:hypothetical protein
MAEMITAERARELLTYDVTTGCVAWKVARGKVRPGRRAGNNRRDGYHVLRVDGRNVLAHRIAWLIVHGVWPSGDLDHINGDPSDNRLANLRDVSHSVNLQNRRVPQASATSGRLGVTWDKRNKRWQAAIRVGGKTRHIGRFDDIDVAAEAYLAAKRACHAGCTI